MKNSNFSAENLKKTRKLDVSNPQYGYVILVSGYPDCQLSIDHNLDVQYHVAGSHTKFHIGFPVTQMNRRSGGRSRDCQNSLDG